MRRGRNMKVNMRVPYTSLIMEMIISYTISEIEIGRDSLRTKVIIGIDLMMSYIISEIETSRNFLRIMA